MKLSRTARNNLTGWAMVAPATIIFGIFTFFAMGYALFISLHSWNMLRPMVWVGLDNYKRAFSSPEFWNSLKVTVLYSIYTIIPSVTISLLIALLLNKALVGVGFYRVAVYLPVITSMAAAAVVWRYIYDPDLGLANYLLGLVGVSPIRWLNDPKTSLPAVAIVGVWKRLGYNAVLYLSGLQGIPGYYYEAAELDGASEWQKTWGITLPLLSPTTFFVVIMQVIASFKVFVSVNIMTNGGPVRSTDVIAHHLFEHSFRYFRMGYGSAIAYILFMIIFLLTLAQFKLEKKLVHYS
jgi:ABC-type sugar transport system permease subunit